MMKYSVFSILSLISRIHTLSAEFTNSLLAGKGNFVSSHGFILYQLATKEKLTMGELSKLINRNKSTATALTKKLVAEGLVKIEPCERDNRIKYLSLTEEGENYSEFTAKVSNELISCSLENFTEEEKNNLLYLLEKINSNIEKALEKKPTDAE